VKSLNLTSVGLEFNSVPFKFGCESVEWKPKKLTNLGFEFGVKSVDEFVEIHDEIEIEDNQAEGIGPQIELDLGDQGLTLFVSFGMSCFLKLKTTQGTHTKKWEKLT